MPKGQPKEYLRRAAEKAAPQKVAKRKADRPAGEKGRGR